MLLPLTGKTEKLADDLRNAAILAQFELAPKNYELSFYDTKELKMEPKKLSIKHYLKICK